jgi:AraC-like DNA-binding protein
MAIGICLLLLLSCEEKIQADPDGNELVSRIIEYFNENLDKKISLDETAKRFFISKYYLCRLFRRHTGGTVLAYLNSKRIAMAQHLISSGEPPTSVFYAVGFRDYSSFYRAYVKETGKPPSASR